ncbi:MAG: hypothetical protein PHR45_01785 [Muribaculaceae bacterium]|nr:hypothetical protein [Muribaculaceae bacterium]
MCCDFSMGEIMLCMGYTNMRSAMNRRQYIVKKLGITTSLEEYLNNYMKNKTLL